MTAVRARRGPVDVGLLTGDRRVASELAAAVAAHAVGLALTVAWLLVLATVIDGAFLDRRDLGSLAPLLAVMVALVLARAAVVWFGDVVAARASGRLRSRIRAHLVEHVVAVGPAGLAHERVGEVSSTIGTGVDELDGYVTRFVPAAALAVIGPLLVFATIAWLDPWTTVILLFAGPMLVLLLAVIGSRTRALTERRFEQLGWLSAFYLDMIRGLATLKAFRRSEDGADTIEDVSRRFGDTTMEVLRTAFQTSLVMEWAATAATALVAVQVSFRMIHDDLPFGTGLAILVLTPEFFVPLRRLALEYHAGQSGDAALARIAEIFATAHPGEPTTGLVLRAGETVFELYTADPRLSLSRFRLTHEVAVLRDRESASVDHYRRLFTRNLRARFAGDPDGDMRAAVTAAAVVAAHNLALREWLAAGAV
ncbi:MAG: ABC transporter transmembrane domain-containing protein, partial [Actinomycetes bacterium]